MSRMRDVIRLYFVSPDGWGQHEDDEARLIRLICAGVSVVQFREKASIDARTARAQRMQAICRDYGAMFIVNDDLALAKALDADGVHVGEDDTAVAEARATLGAQRVVGATARTIERATRAIEEGADYLGVGAIFDARESKADAVTGGLELLHSFRARPELRHVPIVAIGGVTMENASACVHAGADGVAMIRGLWRLVSPEQAILDWVRERGGAQLLSSR